ncbi:sodium/potassium/calcium exchanger 1-like [Oppia nitens]|uniref:sodium/potassium/calcium exchanger 1-like n=1 Tax=Oppia nitens TaxID=1686743 RepID=UPI0023DB7978|nr:sodium/potassium/calcium exchanger 1-like [Oppia nitens]
MGKGLLIAIGLTLTLSSLIPVDSIDHNIETIDITVGLSYIKQLQHPRCNSLNTIPIDDLSVDYKILSSLVGLVGNLLIFIYCCLAIGSLCDKHFVPNLSDLGDSLSLSHEITATLLIPFGTSGPEIFSSIVGILFTDNDIGTGAIIGSSCYNQLAIPAVCGLTVAIFVGRPVKLDSELILKDLFFFIISIIGLIFTIKDNRVDIMDAILLLILFGLYICVKVGQTSGEPTTNNEANVESCEEQSSGKTCDDINDDNSEDSLVFKYLDIVLLPISTLFDITMPSKMSSLYKFFISMIWLSTLSYFSVVSITDFSETLCIPHTIAGMTILAAGSAVPDLVTSVIVIKRTGRASMGISSAISANIFAILLGLGLPWFIKCTINGFYTTSPSFGLYSNSLPFTSCLLLLTVFALILSLKMSDWQLFHKLSYLCGSIHALFLVLTVVVEYLV